MSRILFLLIMLFYSVILYAQKPLTINSSGEFKIVQFTDIHYKAGVDHSRFSMEMITSVLDAENPDLVVFTGDIVVAAPTSQGWDEVLASVISRDIPYMVVFGNHDDESEWSRKQVAEYVSKKSGLINAMPHIDGVKGFMNANVLINDRQGKTIFNLYTLDSHAYSTSSKVKGYGWFDHSQVNWFHQKSRELKENIHDSIPSLAFFHIPLPEYTYAFNDMKNKRVGVRYEPECPPAINSGMFTAFLEDGNVLGTFVGHDHVNNYLVDYYGVALTYGCFSGSRNTYGPELNGARIILLKEGVKGFDTYIRQRDNSIIHSITYPFPSKK